MPAIAFNRQVWRDKLQYNANGAPRTHLYNACVALREAPEFRGRIAFDEFSMTTVVRGELPWSDEVNRPWSNHDDNAATHWLQQNDLAVGREIVQQAVETVAYEHRFHPVRDWLNSLRWDGTPRIHDWLTYHLGAERTPYVQAVGKAWLISAVARIMDPGCKADHMLVLEGNQGIRKSTALKTLASPAWYTDELADFGSKDAGMQMRGVWIIELAELDHFGRSEVSRIKAFMSRSVDRFRPPYGARLITAPRECIFAGTVNLAEYLRDETGGRRFWPVRVEACDIDGLAAEREQLWAEAVHAYRQGEVWWLTEPDIQKQATEEQAERRESDAWEPAVEQWCKLEGHVPFTTTQVLTDAVHKRLSEITDQDNKRIGRILRALGYERKSTKIANTPRKMWQRVSG